MKGLILLLAAAFLFSGTTAYAKECCKLQGEQCCASKACCIGKVDCCTQKTKCPECCKS